MPPYCSFAIALLAITTEVGMVRAIDRTEPPRVIAIRIADPAGAPSSITERAVEEAARIFHRIGVTVLIDEPAPSVSAPGTAPLVVRMILPLSESGVSRAGPDTVLGSATPLINAPRVSVFDTHIQYVAEQRHLQPDMLFGYVLAHEIGHLLLGPHAHSASGLMRAHWDRDDMAYGVAQGSFTFSADEADRIRRVLQ